MRAHLLLITFLSTWEGFCSSGRRPRFPLQWISSSVISFVARSLLHHQDCFSETGWNQNFPSEIPFPFLRSFKNNFTFYIVLVITAYYILVVVVCGYYMALWIHFMLLHQKYPRLSNFIKRRHLLGSQFWEFKNMVVASPSPGESLQGVVPQGWERVMVAWRMWRMVEGRRKPLLSELIRKDLHIYSCTCVHLHEFMHTTCL